MLISCNWLRRHVSLDGVDLDALAGRFTMSVAELEGVHRVGQGLDNVVIGRVLEVAGLEGKKVRLAQVDTGPHGVRAIICGAPNVAAGQRVAVALPGARLGDLVIEVAEVAGVTSHGMIASERELGLGEDHAGILVLGEADAPDAPLGAPLSDAFAVADTLFEVDNKSLTHRPDLWGHRGIAREVAALVGRPLLPLPLDVPFTDEAPLTVRVEDPAACPRYSAVCVTGVAVAPSPLWLRLLLHRVGTRPISNVVDLTNFVMLDLGNPLHAFDRRELAGDTIVVRRAADGEVFTTLDGQDRPLTPRDLLIADAARGIALAGVMGGENSEIRDDTTDVVLEAANFDAATVRLTSQRLGLRTESSARFEKSLDPALVEDASRAFCRQLLALCPGARVTSAFIDVAAPPPPPVRVTLPVALVERRLGAALGGERVAAILTSLGFEVAARDGGAVLDVGVPSYRATKDIGIPEDLIEEVGRVHGYDNITPVPPAVALSQPDPNARKRFEHAVRDYLSGPAGLDEVQTYSFDFDPLLRTLGLDPGHRLTLRNAISAEMPALRRSLVPGLLGVLEKNARAFEAIRVYELGRVFHPRSEAIAGAEGDLTPDEPLAVQPTMLAALIAEPRQDPGEAGLFFALKGTLLGLARRMARAVPEVAPGDVAARWAHPARQARLLVDGQEIGALAELHPLLQERLDVRQRAAILELDLDAWRESGETPVSYRPLPRFPAVYRDFAVVVAGAVPAAAVRGAILAAAPERIAEVGFESAYRGPGLGDDEKSLAWSVTMRHPDRTLADPEVREIEAAIWSQLERQVGGRPRV